MAEDEVDSDALFRARAYLMWAYLMWVALMWVAQLPAPALATLVAAVGAVAAAEWVRACAVPVSVSVSVSREIISARLTDPGAIAEFEAVISSAIRRRWRDGRR